MCEMGLFLVSKVQIFPSFEVTALTLLRNGLPAMKSFAFSSSFPSTQEGGGPQEGGWSCYCGPFRVVWPTWMCLTAAHLLLSVLPAMMTQLQ